MIRQSSTQKRQFLERDRLRPLLCCPNCLGSLEMPEVDQEGPIRCLRCGPIGQLRQGQYLFEHFDESSLQADWLARAKHESKKVLGQWYPWALQTLAPVYAPRWAKRFLKTFDLSDQMVADLGCGMNIYRQPVFLVDGASYPHVHLVCRLEHLPLRSESLDGLVSVAVLEHVPNPQEHVAQMARVLKPGGRVLCYVPFVQGYHASPDDFQRWTLSGFRRLFEGFEILQVRVGAGPTSAMLWIVQEWLALVLSFGSRRLYQILFPLTWILSPLKYLDLLLQHHPEAGRIASAFVLEARKP